MCKNLNPKYKRCQYIANLTNSNLLSYHTTQQNAFHATPKNKPIQAPATARTKEPVSIYNNHSLNAFILTPNINLLRTEYLNLVNQINELLGSEF